MAMAMAMKSIYVPKLIGLSPESSLNEWYRPYDIAQPSPNGMAIPAKPTLAAILQLLARYLRSTSRPTRNRKRTRPRLATSVKFGMEAAGNIADVNPGILPNTDGPSKMPTMTSAITLGCRSFESGQWRRRQKMMTMPALQYY